MATVTGGAPEAAAAFDRKSRHLHSMYDFGAMKSTECIRLLYQILQCVCHILQILQCHICKTSLNRMQHTSHAAAKSGTLAIAGL